MISNHNGNIEVKSGICEGGDKIGDKQAQEGVGEDAQEGNSVSAEFIITIPAKQPKKISKVMQMNVQNKLNLQLLSSLFLLTALSACPFFLRLVTSH